jgi:hypothetical protein
VVRRVVEELVRPVESVSARVSALGVSEADVCARPPLPSDMFAIRERGLSMREG